MSSSCDLAQNIHDVKKEFPDYDFSLLDEFPTPEFWYIDILENESLKENFMKQINETFPNKEDAIKNAPALLASLMKKEYPQEIEKAIDMNTRVTKAKAWLKEKVKEVPEDEFMAVVTHSRFLQSFVSREYGALGEFIGSRRFVNCEVFEYDL